VSLSSLLSDTCRLFRLLVNTLVKQLVNFKNGHYVPWGGRGYSRSFSRRSLALTGHLDSLGRGLRLDTCDQSLTQSGRLSSLLTSKAEALAIFFGTVACSCRAKSSGRNCLREIYVPLSSVVVSIDRRKRRRTCLLTSSFGSFAKMSAGMDCLPVYSSMDHC